MPAYAECSYILIPVWIGRTEQVHRIASRQSFVCYTTEVGWDERICRKPPPLNGDGTTYTIDYIAIIIQRSGQFTQQSHSSSIINHTYRRQARNCHVTM